MHPPAHLHPHLSSSLDIFCIQNRFPAWLGFFRPSANIYQFHLIMVQTKNAGYEYLKAPGTCHLNFALTFYFWPPAMTIEQQFDCVGTHAHARHTHSICDIMSHCCFTVDLRPKQTDDYAYEPSSAHFALAALPPALINPLTCIQCEYICFNTINRSADGPCFFCFGYYQLSPCQYNSNEWAR